MAIFNEFPQTNFHELNLDWIIKVIREIQKEWDDFKIDWEQDVIAQIDNWLESHPEYITTVMDGSLTEPKFAESLKLKAIKDYVTPEMFGAKGDGTTDDTFAVINAFNYCKTHDVYLYADEKTYRTGSDCILDFENYSFNVILNGSFNYLEFRGNPADLQLNTIHIHRVDTVKFVNLLGIHGDIDYCNYFYLIGDSSLRGNGANAYNYFTGAMYRNVILQANGTGWVNENKFYSIRMLDLTINGNINHYADNNSFYDVVLEPIGIAAGVHLSYAQSNYIRYRGEGTLERDAVHSFNNIIERTWTSTKNGYSPIAYEENGTILTNRFIQSAQSKNIYSLTVDNYYNNSNDYTTRKISLPQNQTTGRISVKLDTDSFLHLYSDVSAFTMYIYVYDDNMNNITTSDALGSVFKCPGATFRSGNDPYYSLDGAKVRDVILTLLKQTDDVWLRVAITTGSGITTPHYLHADLISSGAPGYFVDRVVGLKAAAMPTNNNAPLGLIIEDSTGATKGWVHRSSGWAAL